MSSSVLQVSNVKRTLVLLDVVQDSDTPDVVTTDDHTEVTRLEFEVVRGTRSLLVNLSGDEVELDGIVDLHVRVGETDGATVVGDAVGHSLPSLFDGLDTKKLVLGLLRGDLVKDEAPLSVIEETKVLLGLLDLDDIHKSGRVGVVSTDFTVNLQQSLHQNHLGLVKGQSVLQSVPQQHHQRKAFPLFVGPCGRFGRPDTRKFIQHPAGGGGHALHVLLGTTSHGG